MIQSMTGFVTSDTVLTSPDGIQTTVTMSLKSVNARFFETTFRMPHQLYNLEVALEKRLRKRLYRGHVHVAVHVADMSFFKGGVQPALTVIDGYMKAINTITSRYTLSDSLSLDTLLQLPGVFSTHDNALDQTAQEALYAQIESLIDELITVREHEGAALMVDIRCRIDALSRAIQAIDICAQELIEQQKSKLNSLMLELQGQENILADMRKNALAAMLDKIDIHEEIVRFKSHIEHIKKQLDTPDVEKGKKLDFTLQELMREINTITAKCSDAAISAHAINSKVDIEKMREQIQNIV